MVLAKTGPLVVGLTGGVAAGKSTVARMFTELGATVVDADELAREVTSPGTEVHRHIVEVFGPQFLDATGKIDRVRLGEVVFKDPGARRQLEAITHPAIMEAAARRLEDLGRRGHRMVVYEAALLVESGRDRAMDMLVVVVAEDELRLHRLTERNGLSREAALQRLGAQLPQALKASRGDHVIDNSGSLQRTRARVEEVWRELQRVATSQEEDP
jgi:dephospho-CoA kinase